MTSMSKDYSTVTLHRRRFETQIEFSERAFREEWARDEFKRRGYFRLTHDVYAYPLQKITVTHPATWWDGLKQACKRRWPRLFRRLRVRVSVHSLDAEALAPSIPVQLRSSHYMVPIASHSAEEEWQ